MRIRPRVSLIALALISGFCLLHDAMTPMAAADEAAARVVERKAKPNVLFVLADQWRAQATGYAGNSDVKTPRLDRMAEQSVNFVNAVSACPVCSPYRASLITGQYPLTHGVFVNDVCLRDDGTSLAEAFNEAGYQTAAIGKWHLDGHGRSSYIPPERRQGFQYWKVLECTHNYNRSPYYAQDDPTQLIWDGYDAVAQTDDVIEYLKNVGDEPFFCYLAWGPPHNPYESAPPKYRAMYDPAEIALRDNVPEKAQAGARRDLAGYYAHCTALDDCMGRLLDAINEAGLAENTIVVFTSDHGDMIGSQGERRKQRPWDESIRVPMLVRLPRSLTSADSYEAREMQFPLNTPDLMPTLLGLCGIAAPESAEGVDRSAIVLGTEPDRDGAALITCPTPFGEWTRPVGGKEYRGVRTSRYTYVRDRNGPWLLYDNEKDPFQLANLVGRDDIAEVQKDLNEALGAILKERNDEFRSGWDYIEEWGYPTDKNGTVPYR